MITGQFTLEAAAAIATGDDIGEDDVIQSIGDFVTKSLLRSIIGETVQYRLLDTTRAYLQEKLLASGSHDATAKRHAELYGKLLHGAEAQSLADLRINILKPHGDYLGNIRLALAWSFSSKESAALAVELASSAAPLFLEHSLYLECLSWTARALATLDPAEPASPREIELRMCFGWSLMAANGNSEEARAALVQALDLSETLGLPYQAFRVLGLLHMLVQRMGDVRAALEVAERAGPPMPANRAPRCWRVGLLAARRVTPFCGRSGARLGLCESARAPSFAAQAITNIHFGYDHRVRAAGVLVRALWLRGYLDQARQLASSLTDETVQRGHTASLCFHLIWTTPVFIEYGESAAPQALIAKLHEVATQYSLKPYTAVAIGWSGALMVKQGQVPEGIHKLEEAVSRLQVDRYDVLTPRLVSTWAEALSLSGRRELAAATIDRAVALAERLGDVLHMPDILRIRGDIHARSGPEHFVAAQQCYGTAVNLARDQAALVWELRAQMGLARLEGGARRPWTGPGPSQGLGRSLQRGVRQPRPGRGAPRSRNPCARAATRIS